MKNHNMVRKIRKGMYELGRIGNGRAREQGTYGVATGKALNNNGHLEFVMIDFLPKSKWFTYRVGPTDKRGDKPCCHLRGKYDSKKDAIQKLGRKNFTEEF